MLRETKRLDPRALKGQSGFTLVELLVVVGIVVALAAVSIVSVTQFAGKGEEGATAAELDTVQAAMDTMMADKGEIIVTANDLSTSSTTVQDFTGKPAEDLVPIPSLQLPLEEKSPYSKYYQQPR